MSTRVWSPIVRLASWHSPRISHARRATLSTPQLYHAKQESKRFTSHCRSFQVVTTDSSLFSYSSGRFLYYEAARIREQHVPFNVTALKDAVASHLGHGKVTQLSKMSEGGFNRVLIATMEDGFQAVVKIPYQSTVPKTYATASEVATLAFLSSKDIPVPKVYGWSSTTENPVGIE